VLSYLGHLFYERYIRSPDTKSRDRPANEATNDAADGQYVADGLVADDPRNAPAPEVEDNSYEKKL
jgi:hypothetical protein